MICNLNFILTFYDKSKFDTLPGFDILVMHGIFKIIIICILLILPFKYFGNGGVPDTFDLEITIQHKAPILNALITCIRDCDLSVNFVIPVAVFRVFQFIIFFFYTYTYSVYGTILRQFYFCIALNRHSKRHAAFYIYILVPVRIMYYILIILFRDHLGVPDIFDLKIGRDLYFPILDLFVQDIGNLYLDITVTIPCTSDIIRQFYIIFL